MRTERRQELRTNELSQQIEGITEYMKRNAAAMTIVVVLAAVVVGGGFLYKNSQTQKRMDAWASLSSASPDDTPAAIADRAEKIAEQRLNPGLTTAALLVVGQTSLGQMQMSQDAAADKPDVDWEKKAREAYTKVANQRDADITALGQAYIALGLLAEDDGEMPKAAEWYKKIVDDERFAATPFETQAEYRLDNLDEWATPVVFAPAPPMQLAPAAATPAATDTGTPIQLTPVGDAQPAADVVESQPQGKYVNKKIGQLKQHDKPAAPAKEPTAETEKAEPKAEQPAETPAADPKDGGEG